MSQIKLTLNDIILENFFLIYCCHHQPTNYQSLFYSLTLYGFLCFCILCVVFIFYFMLLHLCYSCEQYLHIIEHKVFCYYNEIVVEQIFMKKNVSNISIELHFYFVQFLVYTMEHADEQRQRSQTFALLNDTFINLYFSFWVDD